jgi:hypothetical protein
LGEYIVPTRKPLTPQERKSPPLSALTPNRDQYLKVSPERHFSREHMQREWEKLWTKAWVCAGRVSDLAGAGAWFRFDLGRESFVIVRGADNEITALYNTAAIALSMKILARRAAALFARIIPGVTISRARMFASLMRTSSSPPPCAAISA